MKIGFIGLGNMGTPMAQNLIKAGYYLQVYNRTIAKADELDQAAIARCQTPAEAAADVPFVVTILSEDEILKEAVSGEHGLLQTLPKGGVHISMSTISPETSQQLSDLHEQAGSHYVACPVFGRPEAAAAKGLRICTSGKAEHKQAAKPILEALGQSITDFGEQPGNANVVKVAGNFMIQAAMEAMAEAYTLGEKSGVDRLAMAEFFGSTIFNAPIYQNYGKLIANKQYQPVGFKAVLGLKDARLAIKLSQATATPMPLAMLAHNRLLAAVAKGRGDEDWVEGFGKGVSDDAGV